MREQYRDYNKFDNHLSQYRSLVMGTSLFDKFYTLFKHHAIPLNFPQDVLLADLKEKLPLQYKKELILYEFQDTHTLAKFC